MVKYYKTDDRQIHEEEKIQNGVWIQMVNPSVAEGQMIADALNVDIEDVLAALDEEESSRIELQDGYTLILVDIPSIEIRHDKESHQHPSFRHHFANIIYYVFFALRMKNIVTRDDILM